MVFLCPMVLLCPMVFLCPVKNPPYNDDKEVRNPAMKRKKGCPYVREYTDMYRYVTLRRESIQYVQMCYVFTFVYYVFELPPFPSYIVLFISSTSFLKPNSSSKESEPRAPSSRSQSRCSQTASRN